MSQRMTNFNSTLSSGNNAAALDSIAAIEAGNGSGTIDGSSVTTITGTAAAVVQAIADIDTDPTNFNSTLSDSVVVAAADIVSILANNGSGTVAVSSATSFTGTAANVAAVASAVMSPISWDKLQFDAE